MNDFLETLPGLIKVVQKFDAAFELDARESQEVQEMIDSANAKAIDTKQGGGMHHHQHMIIIMSGWIQDQLKLS